jgi:hypothetical protein
MNKPCGFPAGGLQNHRFSGCGDRQRLSAKNSSFETAAFESVFVTGLY